jgi:hypothetical protein
MTRAAAPTASAGRYDDRRNMFKNAPALCVIVASLACAAVGIAADVDEFTKATQNPLAHIISVPLQNNTSFGIGPYDRNQNVLNIQPVIPFQAGPVTFASRTIIPRPAPPPAWATSTPRCSYRPRPPVRSSGASGP